MHNNVFGGIKNQISNSYMLNHESSLVLYFHLDNDLKHINKNQFAKLGSSKQTTLMFDIPIFVLFFFPSFFAKHQKGRAIKSEFILTFLAEVTNQHHFQLTLVG